MTRLLYQIPYFELTCAPKHALPHHVSRGARRPKVSRLVSRKQKINVAGQGQPKHLNIAWPDYHASKNAAYWICKDLRSKNSWMRNQILQGTANDKRCQRRIYKRSDQLKKCKEKQDCKADTTWKRVLLLEIVKPYAEQHMLTVDHFLVSHPGKNPLLIYG